MSSRAKSATHRIRQGLHALTISDPPSTPQSISDDRVVLLFESLSVRDRYHLVAAYEIALLKTSDPVVQLATLLHDFGKVTLSGKRISLPARVVAVLDDRLPGRVRELIRPKLSGAWLTGPWLAEHHAQLGAERLRALGIAEDVCWLVENHDIHDLADRRLELLRDIDSSTL